MKWILLIGLSFAVVQGMTSSAFADESKKPKSTFVRPVTKKKVLVAAKQKKVWVAFKLKDTKVRNPAGRTPEEIQADPQAAADLRSSERAQAVRNEAVPDDSGAL